MIYKRDKKVGKYGDLIREIRKKRKELLSLPAKHPDIRKKTKEIRELDTQIKELDKYVGHNQLR